jgi:cell division septum initiation protein DivIVA
MASQEEIARLAEELEEARQIRAAIEQDINRAEKMVQSDRHAAGNVSELMGIEISEIPDEAWGNDQETQG